MPNHVQNIIYFKKFSDIKSHNHEDYEDLDSKEIRNILEKIKYDDKELGTIDFNKIIPMPETLRITSGGMTKTAVETYLSCINPYNADDYGYEEKVSESYYNNLKIKIKNSNWLFKELKDDLTKKEVTENIEKYLIDVSRKKTMWHKSKYEYCLLDYAKTIIKNVTEYGCTDWYDWSCTFWGTKWNSYDPWPWEDDNCIGYNTAWSGSHPVLRKMSSMYPDVMFLHYWADEDFGSNVGLVAYYDGEEYLEYIPDFNSKDAYELAAEIQGIDLNTMYYYDENNETYIYLSNYFSISENAYNDLVVTKKLISKNFFKEIDENEKEGKIYKFDYNCNDETLKEIYNAIYSNGYEIIY